MKLLKILKWLLIIVILLITFVVVSVLLFFDSEKCAAFVEIDRHSMALPYCQETAEQGDAYSQFYMGVIHNSGQAVPRNPAEAFKWFEKSAAQNHAFSQFFMAQMYRNGDGVEKNEAEAMRLYRQSAEQGNPGAQYYLGQFYLRGENGVTADVKEAYIWFSLAAEDPAPVFQEFKQKAAQELTDAEIQEAQPEIQRRLAEINSRQQQH